MKQPSTSAPEKPILDEESFQQLLAAAYVLQQQNDKAAHKGAPADYAQVLSEIVETQTLIQTHQLDLAAAAELISKRVLKFTGASGAAVGVVDGEQLRYQAASGSAAGEAGSETTLPASLSAHCLASGQILQSPVTTKDARLRAELCRKLAVNALIAVPVFREGKVAGVLELRALQPNAFHEQDLRTCQLMAGLLTEAIARAAEREWKQALAAERATMLQALEKLKPQLERMMNPQPPAAPAPPVAEEVKAVEAKVEPKLEPTPLPDAEVEADEEQTVVCRGCGHILEEEESFCGLCGMARPGEPSGDIQSKWASLWHMQQAAQKKHAPAQETDVDEEPDEEDSAAALHTSAMVAETKKKVDAIIDASVIEEDGEEADASALRIVPTEAEGLAKADGSPWTSATRARTWLESVKSEKGFKARVNRLWRLQRANIYLGISALLLFFALLGLGWRSTESVSASAEAHAKRPVAPQLTFFEQMLVSLGLAVPPPAPVYNGNPSTQVWVDTKTALYYCPGSDLYGKTEAGKYTTQRDAQLDQFQPAYRRACD